MRKSSMKSFFLVESGRIERRETPVPYFKDGELVIKGAPALTCGTPLCVSTAHRGSTVSLDGFILLRAMSAGHSPCWPKGRSM